MALYPAMHGFALDISHNHCWLEICGGRVGGGYRHNRKAQLRAMETFDCAKASLKKVEKNLWTGSWILSIIDDRIMENSQKAESWTSAWWHKKRRFIFQRYSLQKEM